jgi:hypothetical protein
MLPRLLLLADYDKFLTNNQAAGTQPAAFFVLCFHPQSTI